MKISAIFETTDTTKYIQDTFKSFILGVARFEVVTVPTHPITIFVDTLPMNIEGGHWKINILARTIYIGYKARTTDETPLWAVGVLSAIAQVFQLHDDPEVKEAIRLMLCKLIAGGIETYNSPLISTQSNIDLTSLAANKVTKVLAAEIEPEVWVFPNGEPADTSNEEDWIKLKLI